MKQKKMDVVREDDLVFICVCVCVDQRRASAGEVTGWVVNMTECRAR